MSDTSVAARLNWRPREAGAYALGYFALALIAALLPSSWLKDIIVAPLFALVPLGVGLAALRPRGLQTRLVEMIGARETVLSAIVIGWVLITSIFAAIEPTGTTEVAIRIVGPLLFVLSAVGFLVSGRVLQHAIEVERETPASWWLAYALTALLVYNFLFLHFTDFPLRDVFQDIHFMKGALEFSKFGVLNPFTADSYAPLLQVHMGLMHRFFGFDLLRGQWLLPWVVFAFQFLCMRCFFGSLPLSRRVADLSALLGIVLIRVLFSKSNNDLLAAMSLVVFSSLNHLRVSEARTSVSPMRSWQRVIVILLTMLMVRYFLLLQTALLFWQVVAVFFAFFLVARTRFFDLVWFAGIVVICFPIHRSVIMFFPIAIFWSWIFSLGATRDWGRRESWKYPLIFIIPAVCYAFFSGALLLWIYAHPIALGFANGANAIMFKVYSVLTGKPRIAIDSLDLVSSSYQNSFVEWVRVSSPALHIIGIVFLATTFAWNWKRPREQRTSAQTTSLILGAVSVVAAATALTFSGIPFIYRGQFFIVLFQSIFIALCLDEAFESGWMKSPAFRAIAALSIAAFANVSAVSFYKFQWSFAQILNPYLSRLFPINQLLLIAVATLGLIVATRALKNERLTVKMLLVSALLLDTFSVVTKFYEYSYGSAFPEPRIIAHYERRDLEAAKLIENLPAGTMLFSDPFTISMLKATTGFNGLYGNENLADLKPEKLKHVRATLNALLVSASALESETLKDVEQREALGPEALYAFERAHGKGSYTFENVRPSIIFAISRRSLDYNPPNGTGYYPPYRELEPREVETLERNLDVIARHGNYMVFARLKSQGPDAHLGKVNAQKESRSN